ncbi:putative DNA polymerase delta catalytic subunit [Corchorus olitorius]|uniref:DNA polymerase delta catalytic subunit n=1 Tax=Corchorus olitorius TaxID=93759 RepID=A0A1R3JDB5_9ROSI|nr:putative DNA polymerase delta catalytic subunit [Corchorus olitorius]
MPLVNPKSKYTTKVLPSLLAEAASPRAFPITSESGSGPTFKISSMTPMLPNGIDEFSAVVLGRMELMN